VLIISAFQLSAPKQVLIILLRRSFISS